MAYTQHTLNYSALSDPLTKADSDSYEKYATQNRSKLTGALITRMIIASPLIVAFTTFSEGSLKLTIIMTFIATLIALIAWVAVAKPYLLRKARLYKFATQNELQFLSEISQPEYPGMIFNYGEYRRIRDGFRFADGTEIGNYTHTTDNVKFRHIYKWSYARMKLERRLPHMILDSRSNNFWKLSNLNVSFDQSQVLQLEGDFNNYFTLYTPKQYERDALYIFTPDVMATMVDRGKEFDIEIVEDELFIYGNKHFALDSPDFYVHILAIMNTISAKLAGQTSYYADEKMGSRALNMVSLEGQRLRSRSEWLMIIVIVIAVIGFGFALLYLLLQLQPESMRS